MDPRGGNRQSRAPSRSTGFAPTGTKKQAGRPAGRSVSRTRKAENARFRAGSRQGDGATRRSLMSARCGPNWLPSPRLTTGRFSKSSGPTNGRSIFFMRSEVSDRREQLEVPRRPARRRRRQGRAISATRRRRNRRFSSANSGFPQARTPPTQVSRPTAAASSANKVLVNQRMKRVRWSMRSKCPRHRWSDRPEWRLEPRTKRRMPPDGENPEVKTGSLAKMDPHPVRIVVRGDSGFCRDGTWCDDSNVDCLSLATPVRRSELASSCASRAAVRLAMPRVGSSVTGPGSRGAARPGVADFPPTRERAFRRRGS